MKTCHNLVFSVDESTTSLLHQVIITFSLSIPKSEQVCSANMSYSTKESSSHSRSILSLAVSFPCKIKGN